MLVLWLEAFLTSFALLDGSTPPLLSTRARFGDLPAVVVVSFPRWVLGVSCFPSGMRSRYASSTSSRRSSGRAARKSGSTRDGVGRDFFHAGEAMLVASGEWKGPWFWIDDEKNQGEERDTYSVVALALRRCVRRMQVDEKFSYTNSEMRTKDNRETNGAFQKHFYHHQTIQRNIEMLFANNTRFPFTILTCLPWSFACVQFETCWDWIRLFAHAVRITSMILRTARCLCVLYAEICVNAIPGVYTENVAGVQLWQKIVWTD